LSPPRVVRASGVEAAAEARGAVVVIDVLRAFTTAAYAFGAGARAIVLVATHAEAFALRDARFPDALLVGEIGGRPIPGFDHGNSPEAVARLDLSGRTLILRSSSGTQGVVRARAAASVWLGSLVVATATARALAAERAVTLLAMGSTGGPDGPEDEACAELLERLLAGREPDAAAVTAAVRASPAARKAFDPSVDWITPGDVEHALAIDRFDFAMRVDRRDGLLVARPVRS